MGNHRPRVLLIASLFLVASTTGLPRVSAEYIRGDVNGNGGVEILPDAMFLLGHLFFEEGDTPPCLQAADVNGDGAVNATDFIYLANFGFLAGPEPAAPFPECDLPDPDYDPLPTVTCIDDSGCS